MIAAVEAMADTADRTVTITVPGPNNLSYLPIDLIPKIGADRAESLLVRVQHRDSGSAAMRDLVQRNSDFAATGLPAQLFLNSRGGDIVTVAAINDLPVFVLMVRHDLAGQIRSIADLRGRIVAVPKSDSNTKTTPHQMLDLLLHHAGIASDEVRLLASGQSWSNLSALMSSGSVDAIMGAEPFASRLLASGKVFFLVNLAEARKQQTLPGTEFLQAALATRRELLQQDSTVVQRMVAALQRSLAWIASHSATEVADRMDLGDADERNSIITALEKYPRLYSKDGHFFNRQLRDTELFFRWANPDVKQPVELSSMIDSRWVGMNE
ncbi:MAG: ABC transporter substrate-binding protein [Magnetococcales bacterium]|nr:ABC transporter substrate-binding protein [Magnetococcales bacterium]